MTATRIAVFASGYGANLETCLRLARRRPDLMTVAVVVSDRPGCRATQIARAAGIRCIARPFDRLVGRASDCTDHASHEAYNWRARQYHDDICRDLVADEQAAGGFGAVVFSYRRWVHGKLLDQYGGRIINQHPGDLTLLDRHGRRQLIGNDPVFEALRIGCPTVRTTTFLVDDGHDTGSIVAQGPELSTSGYAATRQDATLLEHAQKRVSDPPSLICALLLLLTASVAYGAGPYPDGSRRLAAGGHVLPFGGIDAGRLRDGDPQCLASRTADLLREQLQRDVRDLGLPGEVTRVAEGRPE